MIILKDVEQLCFSQLLSDTSTNSHVPIVMQWIRVWFQLQLISPPVEFKISTDLKLDFCFLVFFRWFASCAHVVWQLQLFFFCFGERQTGSSACCALWNVGLHLTGKVCYKCVPVPPVFPVMTEQKRHRIYKEIICLNRNIIMFHPGCKSPSWTVGREVVWTHWIRQC